MSSTIMIPSEINQYATMLFIALALVGFTSSLVFRQPQRKNNKKPWPKVRGALPIIGNFHQLKSPNNLVKKMEEWADEYSQEHGCYEMNLMGDDYLVVCSQERFKEIMAHRHTKTIRDPQMSEAARSVGADGVFSSEGKQWKGNRRLMAPAFNHAHIRDFMPYIKLIANRLMQKWRSNDTPTDADGAKAINQDVFAYAMDSTSLTTLGKDFNSLNTESLEADDLNKTFHGVIGRVLSPIPYWKIPVVGQYLDGLGWSLDHLIASLNNLVDSYNSGEDHEGDESLVKKVISQSQKDKSFQRQQIIGNLLTMLFAGTDSTAAMLCTVIQYLAQDDTGLQEELLAEIESAFPENIDDVTLDDLSPEKLPRLKSFILEILRFSPPFPYSPLYITGDIPFCGTTLKKGTKIMCLQRYPTCNPHKAPTGVPLGPNGEDATVFCARRYLKTSQDGSLEVQIPPRNSTSFLAFGNGPRVCLGQAFANASISYTATALIRNFDMKLAQNHEPIGRVTLLAHLPDTDIRVVFTDRNQ